MNLRPYQTDCLARMRAELGIHQSVLLTAPCGSGKGTLITFMVNTAVARDKKVIFAVHGKALVHDMSERVRKLGISHGVLMGSHRRERWHAVQVCSIDTLHRMEYPPPADLIIADECHLSLSPTWRKTIERYPAAKLVGCTATPCRLDGQGLGRASGGLFDSLVLGPSEQELIDLGYLVRSRVLAPPPPRDLGTVKKTAGEFNAKQMATVCDKAKVIGDIVQHWKRHAAGRKTAAFGVDQAHAMHIAEQFRTAGVNWAYVDADTSDDERQRIWKDLDEPNGNLMGVSSCGITMIGWDHPIVSCLVVARKTASLGLWRQMLGRSSRIYPGKTDALILDHVGNTHEHFPYGLFETPPLWSLDGKAVADRDNVSAASVTTCRGCYATFATGPTTCPYCHAPITKTSRIVQVEEGELSEVEAPKRQAKPETMRKVYDSLRLKQAEHGYKDSYASAAFKGMYGFWPPKTWMRALPDILRERIVQRDPDDYGAPNA